MPKDIEIFQFGTEQLRGRAIEHLTCGITQLCERGNVVDIMLLGDILFWFDAQNGLPTSRCLLADRIMYYFGFGEPPAALNTDPLRETGKTISESIDAKWGDDLKTGTHASLVAFGDDSLAIEDQHLTHFEYWMLSK